MTLATHHLVQPFLKTKTGRISPGLLRECASAEQAKVTAEQLVSVGFAVGAVAMSRVCDPEMGDYDEPDILLSVGRVPGDEDLPF